MTFNLDLREPELSRYLAIREQVWAKNLQPIKCPKRRNSERPTVQMDWFLRRVVDGLERMNQQL